jgi:GT2 family glycosyltransferase
LSISLVLTYFGDPPTLKECIDRIGRQTVQPAEVLRLRGDGVHTESQDIETLFRAAHGDYIATTNADCYIPERFIEYLSFWLESGFDIASGVRVPSVVRLPSKATTKMRPGMGVSGSGMMFRRKVLNDVLPFRFPTGWDVELTLRSRGLFIVDPKVKVFHDDPYTPGRFLRKSLRYLVRNGSMVLSFGGWP